MRRGGCPRKEGPLKEPFLRVLHCVDLLWDGRITCPVGLETHKERDEVCMINPLSIIGEELKKGDGSDAGLRHLGVIEAAGICVLGELEYEFARPALGGSDGTLVCQLG